jgi:hypothetical protein
MWHLFLPYEKTAKEWRPGSYKIIQKNVTPPASGRPCFIPAAPRPMRGFAKKRRFRAIFCADTAHGHHASPLYGFYKNPEATSLWIRGDYKEKYPAMQVFLQKLQSRFFVI